MGDELAKKVARSKARLLWSLIATTPEVGALAEPMQRETRFDDLAKQDQVTVLALVTQFERGCRDIETQAARRKETPTEGAPITSESAATAQGEIVESRAADQEAADAAADADPPPPDVDEGATAA